MPIEKEIDRLIQVLPDKFGKNHVTTLYQESNWDEESCKWFVWQLKTSLRASLTSYVSETYGKFYLPDLKMLGVTRFAPMGSKKQMKNLERITNEMGDYLIDDSYKDIAKSYISYMGISLITYYVQGHGTMLSHFIKESHFTTALKEYTDLLFKTEGDGLEEDDETIWDPYNIQNHILNDLKFQNEEIVKSNNDKDSEEEKPLILIPKSFDILTDRHKISPL